MSTFKSSTSSGATPPSSSAPPTSFSLEVSDVQESLVRLTLRLKSQIESFSSPALTRSTDGHVQMESLNADVRRQISAFRERLAELERLALRQSDPRVKDMLQQDVSLHRQQLASCHAQFRQANLKCLQELQKNERQGLMAPPDDDSVRKRQGAKNKDQLLQQSGQVTDHLQSLSRQLAATVERSSLTVDDLAGSSQTVSDTHDEFKTLGAAVGRSRKLLTKYGRRGGTDKVLIFLAFAFFMAVVFYVLRKRVLGPLDPTLLLWNLTSTLVGYVARLLGW